MLMILFLVLLMILLLILLQNMFEMNMVSELTYFLGLQMKQTEFGIYINQAKYARNVVKRFGLDKAAHARTPMAANAKLTNDPSGESVNVTLYRSMIGCLLYLTASRPDIAFNVGVCSKFQSNPKISHLKAVKRIIKYVVELVIMDCFIAKSQICFLLDSLIQIGPTMPMIEKAPLVGVFM